MKAIVIVARGLRASSVGCYGNAWIETPALDALAAAGVVFDQHFADAADPAAARRAWRTGRYSLPSLEPLEGDARQDLFAELRQRGVAPWLIVDRSPSPGTEAQDCWNLPTLVEPNEVPAGQADLIEATEQALHRLADHSHWLLWLDLGTLLPPCDVPEEFTAPYFPKEEPSEDEDEDEAAEPSDPLVPLLDPALGPIDPDDDSLYLSLHNTYGAAVSYLDNGIGGIQDLLKENHLDEDALVIVTSDVGQALGEHGMIGPVRPWAHEEMIHLPLIVRLPRQAEAGRRVAALTQAVDLAPTLAEFFGATMPDTHGKSLWPLLRGVVEKVREYAVAGVRVGEEIEWCLRMPEWAFLLPIRLHPDDERRGPQLFVKPDDRWEVNDVRHHHPELVERLERTLHAFLAATRRDGPLKPPPLPSEGSQSTGTV